MFLNMTASTKILLCEETLEMILTVTYHPPSGRLQQFPSPFLKHAAKCASVCLPVLMSG